MQEDRAARQGTHVPGSEARPGGVSFRTAQPSAYQLDQANVDAIQGFLLDMQQQQLKQQHHGTATAGQQEAGGSGAAASPVAKSAKHTARGFPGSPDFTMNLESLWPGASPGALGELSNGAWDEATRFETPLRQAVLSEIFSPSPARRPLQALQVSAMAPSAQSLASLVMYSSGLRAVLPSQYGWSA